MFTVDAHGFAGRDGVELVFREAGEGRPLVMLPGFAGGGARMFEYGRTGAFAAEGHRVVVPDFRGHGDSAKPHDRAAYPPDVLVDDVFALVEHLGLGDGEYDLGGYSLGGRVVVRALVRGARPRRAIVAGQGLVKVSGPQGDGRYRRVLTSMVDGTELEPDSAEARMAYWFSQIGVDPLALILVLDSLVPTAEEELRRISVPTLVLIGDEDERSDADELAALLGDARFVRVPGDHGGAFVAPELGAAVADFLSSD